MNKPSYVETHPTKVCVKCGGHTFNVFTKGTRKPKFTRVCVKCDKKQPA